MVTIIYGANSAEVEADGLAVEEAIDKAREEAGETLNLPDQGSIAQVLVNGTTPATGQIINEGDRIEVIKAGGVKGR